MAIRNWLPYAGVIGLAFLADRVSKRWAAAYLNEHGPTEFGAWFSLREVHNAGIGFGLWQGSGPLVGWLTILILAGLVVWLVKTPSSQWLLRLGLAMLIGGALGNMVDRITVGQVLDFIQTPVWPRIFNVADIMIRGGVVFVLVGAFVQRADS